MTVGMEIPSSLAARLHAARHVVALTGAGISAESGVPTFRDAQTGLWARYRPEELVRGGVLPVRHVAVEVERS